MLEYYNLPLHTTKWQRKRSTSVKMYGKNYNRPFPHYAPVSKHKELRTRLGWTISCKSLYFQSFSISRRPKSSNGFFYQELHWNTFKQPFHIKQNDQESNPTYQTWAPINVKLAGGRQGIGWGFGDLIFLKNLPSNSLPSFQSIATKFPHPGMYIAVHPKAGPKKGAIKICSNKNLQSFFINVTASPKIDVPVKAAIIRFNHSIRVLIHSIEYRNL